jgi:hypothetical protein
VSVLRGSPVHRFSLFNRGPLFDLTHRAGLAGPDNPGHPRLWLVVTAVAWLPLVLLSLAEGKAYGAPAGTTVLSDWGLTGRLLVGMPLLLAAQTRLDRLLAWVDDCFCATGLVSAEDHPRLDQVVLSTTRLASSTTAEIAILMLALVQSSFLVYEAAAHGAMQWAFVDGSARLLSRSGWWAVCVAMPLSTVVSIRWLWRIVLWWRFCWKVSRLRLRIVPSHPDGAGGLGFLNLSLMVFAVAAAGMLASVSGHFATRILAAGAGISDLQLQFLGGLLGTLIIFAGPLVLFTRTLARAKVAGIARYGALVCQQGQAFETRWLVPGAGDAQSLAEPDFSARTDLNSVAQLVYEMRLTVFRGRHLLVLLGGAAAPSVPVAFLLVPAKEILQGLVGLLF